MTAYLTPEQANALRVNADSPMRVIDPTSQRVYFVVDGELLVLLTCRADLPTIHEGIANMQAGCLFPVEQARLEDRYQLLLRFGP